MSTNNASWIAATGYQVQQNRLEVIAQNLANSSTAAFKEVRLATAELPYRIERAPGAQQDTGTLISSGIQWGGGTYIAGTQRDYYKQGSAELTQNPYDTAIIGSGFFQVEMPDGSTAYTRAGRWHLDQDRRLVNMQELPLFPQIIVPQDVGQDQITIGRDGTVSALQGDRVVQLGQITLVEFMNPDGLLAIGEGLYRETPASGMPNEGTPGSDGLGTLKQYQYEGSNVKAVEQILNLLDAQRSAEFNMKVITASNDMARQIANVGN